MESGRSRTPSSATSRRELRTRRSAAPAPARRRPSATTLSRSALLVALGAATIAVPVVEEVRTPEPTVEAAAVTDLTGYPTAYEVLSAATVDVTPTSLLAAAPEVVRMTDSASRALERSPLPDCDGTPVRDTVNGQIAASDLCTLWDGTHMLRGDAAVALAELNLTFRAAYGRDLCLTDSYRTLAEQRRLAYTKGGLAATPGTSNHGWGLAIDLCHSETANSGVMRWLNDNGPVFGWENPPWAVRGGSGRTSRGTGST